MIKNAFYNQGVQSIMCLLVLLKYKNRIVKECAKFRGSRAIVGLVGLVPSFYHAFMGRKIFLLGISRVKSFFSWVSRGSNSFFAAYFVIQRFPVFGCMRKSDRKQKYIKRSQTAYPIPNWF